jgi:hypothetical protein
MYHVHGVLGVKHFHHRCAIMVKKIFYEKRPCEILHNSNNEEYLEDEGEEYNEENSVKIEEEIGNGNELHFRGKKSQ